METGEWKTNPFLPTVTQEVEKEFIEAYEKLPQLWDRKHPDYTNKYRRNAALDNLLHILKKLNEKATLRHVKEKINIFRCAYRKDLRKHLMSKRIGPNGVTYEYTPGSWKFHALKFLGCNENDKVGEDSIVEVNVEEPSFEEPGSDNSSSEDGGNATSISPLITESVTTQKRKRKIKHEVDEKREIYFIGNSETTEREFEAIGANVACKLQRMTPQQQCYAELLINKVLIYGIQNSLSEDTDLTEVYKT